MVKETDNADELKTLKWIEKTLLKDFRLRQMRICVMFIILLLVTKIPNIH